MKYADLRKKLQSLPVLPSREIIKLGSAGTMHNQLNQWQKKGLLIQLRRGMYILNSADRKIAPSMAFLAGQLYAPSYVSMEYALSFYGLIPEGVPVVTSITTKKTAEFANEFGRFTYQTIKPAAFRGFTLTKDAAGLAYFMAEPEKAVVDFIYLNLPKFSEQDSNIFTESYRFQQLEQLKAKKLLAYASLFNMKKLTLVVKNLIELATREK